jgi:probable HAF family extracellular repeat protein
MTDLGTLGGTSSYAYHINELGQATGILIDTAGAAHAFIWENGVMTRLDMSGNIQSSAPFDINDKGQVVGNATNVTGHSRGFVWQNGALTFLGTGIPYDINNNGQSVGYTTQRGQAIAALWVIRE